jgi:LmbE family N-acetylglucosaminyl deacetylase
MGIGAHQDDLEFNMLHGVLECFQKQDKWFTGVTVTDGRGSARANQYANYTDEQMQQVRRGEQKKAAYIGEYAALVSLDYSSAQTKDPKNSALIDDLKAVIVAAAPEYIYTHNPADKHDTHVGVVIAALQALREIPKDKQPKAVYGVECWRSLDWMMDNEKIVFDVSTRENVAASLWGLYDSQISGGKRYDVGIMGRKKCNATLLSSHATDTATMLEFAMDLTPIIRDPSLDIGEYVRGFIRRFEADVAAKISKRLGK